MATLAEIKAQVTTLQQSEEAQTEIIGGLGNALAELIVLVQDLRVNLSPEEQAHADETMVSVSATLQNTASQSQALQALAAQAAEAAGGPVEPEEPNP
jgi:hypothetical protein